MTNQAQSDDFLQFEASAYLQRLLGRDLISSNYIAVTELVKNAYDAGARQVTITLENKGDQKLTISDNGKGLSIDEFRTLWMSPGYSEKTDTSRETVDNTQRVMLGEKGIGRFAADKLARRLIVRTKKSGSLDRLEVIFNWDRFNNRKDKLVDIRIPYTMTVLDQSELFTSGTLLELEELRTVWNLTSWKRLRTELSQLITPYVAVSGFLIIANASGWPSGPVGSPFEAGGGYKYSFFLTKGGILRQEISRPTAVAKKLSIAATEQTRGRLGTGFGPVKGEFYYVDRPITLLRRGFEPGIGIYRDGFRVEPYGRPTDDWLEVQADKASRQGHAPISPTRLFGFVAITRTDNSSLRDITNRQGLQDTKEFDEFSKFVRDEFKRFAKFVREERNQLQQVDPAYQAQQVQKARQVKAETFAEMAAQMAHQLRQPMNNIGINASNLKEYLERNSLLDDNMQKWTTRIKDNITRMDAHLKTLSLLAAGLKDLKSEFDLGLAVREIVQRSEDEIEQSGVQLTLENCEAGYTIKFSRLALDWILENFIKNAVRAAAQLVNGEGSVKIKVIGEAQSGYQLVVSDNGEGVPSDLKTKLFVTNMQSDHGGFGMGLYWSRFWAEEYGATLNYNDATPSGAVFTIKFEVHV